MALRIAVVAIDARSAGARATYTYLAEEGAAPGQAWLVPLGPRRAVGYVLEVKDAEPEELGFDPKRLRPLGTPIEGLDLHPVSLDLLRETCRQTLSAPSVALGLVMPPGLNRRLAATYSFVREPEEKLHAAQDGALRAVKAGALKDRPGAKLEEGVKRALNALARKGCVRRVYSLVEPAAPKASRKFRLTPDEAQIESYLKEHSRRRPAQAMTLVQLRGSEQAAFTGAEIARFAGVTQATVKALVEAGLLIKHRAGEGEVATPPTPNAAQAAALKAITEAEGGTLLLHGVTGSGKTEVYLRAAADALAQGKQVLYLVPEIALTAQAIAQIRARFGDAAAVLHSALTPAERLAAWLKIRRGEAPVVLGPRSALFAPLERLGLIVMDEEHEASYKQETAPRYSTHTLAEWLAQRHGCPLVLGSATPRVETMWRSEIGEIQRLELPQRAAAQARMPMVEVADLREGYQQGQPTIFTPALQDLLTQEVGAGNQAILFLNRRSFAPFLMCRQCGHRTECPDCAVALALHKGKGVLMCHHCGHTQSPPEKCPQCGSDEIGAFGIGTQRVEVAAQELLPGARIARLDRDVVQRKGALERIMAGFRARELDVLVGTQMVAKGLDFPHVTAVGVIAADIALNIPDFRATERTFQLLSQVSGRAGRAEKPGRVVIQTFDPENPAVQYAAEHDYDSLYQALREERGHERHGYPPFVRLVNILMTSENREALIGLAALAAERLRKAEVGEVLGPVPCPLERLNRRWRHHILVKMPRGADPGPVQQALKGLSDSAVRVVVDVDPMSMA